MEPIIDHRTLIDRLGGNKVVSEGLSDCTPGRVGQWKIGNRIPPEYWSEITALACKAEIDGIDAQWLVDNLRPRQMPVSDQGAAA